MAPLRSQSKERQYQRRGNGVMKKANDVYNLIPGVKTAVLFLDGRNLWIYESEEGWVSSLPSMRSIDVERLTPAHFTSVFVQQEALRRRASAGTTDPHTSSPSPEPSLFVSRQPQPRDESPPAPISTAIASHIRRSSQELSPTVERVTRGRRGGADSRGRMRATPRARRSRKDIFGFIDMNEGGGDGLE